MTISSQTRKAGPFVGNDSTTAFPFAFKVFSAADMYVVKTDVDLEVETVLVLNTNYTVSLNADQNANPGGTITLPSALATGFTLTVTSNISPLQQTDLTNQGGFYPSVITNALDKLTILIQQALDSIGRSLKLPVSASSSVSTTLPLPSSNKLIGWNQDADGLQNVDPTTLATIVAFGTANADVFSGDGVTTQFNLSANPGALNNLDVSIGGVTQAPGLDYTWSSGTVITFTSAPPVGTDNVLVRYMQGLPQGASDSAASTFIQSGSGAVQRIAQDKMREWVSAADYGATGASTATDQAAIVSACAAVSAAGGGYVRVNKFISTSIDLASLSLPTNVTLFDERYAGSGWWKLHNEGADAEFGLRGRATALGEGPSLVMQNLASSGNRNVSIVHWYGPTNSPTVVSFEHWGYNSDGAWYGGREWLSKGSIDTGARARTRHGNDGGIIFNPNGDATSYRNNPAQGFSTGYHFVFQAPLQSGYTYSGKMLAMLHNTHMGLPIELRLQTDTGESGAAVSNPTIKFQTGLGPSAVNKWGLLGEFPSSGQWTLYDYIAGVNKIVSTSGGSTSFTGGVSFVVQTAASAANNTLFVDSADNKLKYKGLSGTLTVLANP